GRWLYWAKRLHEGLLKVVDVLEILDRIFRSFSKYSGIDQIKNHVSNIFAGMNTPVIETRHDHRSEFFERVLPDTVVQLRHAHVAHRSALYLLLLFRGEIKRIPQKHICIPLVTRVAGHHGIKSFSKSNFLH